MTRPESCPPALHDCSEKKLWWNMHQMHQKHSSRRGACLHAT